MRRARLALAGRPLFHFWPRGIPFASSGTVTNFWRIFMPRLFFANAGHVHEDVLGTFFWRLVLLFFRNVTFNKLINECCFHYKKITKLNELIKEIKTWNNNNGKRIHSHSILKSWSDEQVRTMHMEFHESWSRTSLSVLILGCLHFRCLYSCTHLPVGIFERNYASNNMISIIPSFFFFL